MHRRTTNEAAPASQPASMGTSSAQSGSYPNSSTSIRQQSSGAKRSVATEPASFGKFASLLMMYVCKRVLLIRPLIKLLIYLAVIFFVSLVTDHFPVPRSYFSNKRNILNTYFVKFGWGWTCTLVGLFIYFTSHTYCCGNVQMINRHLSRLAVATGWWYVSVSIFDRIHSSYGMCSLVPGNNSVRDKDLDQLLTRDSCESAGRRWIAFDVSGHAFLLIHCLLIISEEARCVGNGWERMVETIDVEESKKRLDEEQARIARDSHNANSTKIRWLALSLTALMLLWELMLFVTVLYFHNMPQKFIGAMFAVVGWFLTYRLWYQYDTWWSPGLPGRGSYKYLRDN